MIDECSSGNVKLIALKEVEVNRVENIDLTPKRLVKVIFTALEPILLIHFARSKWNQPL